MFSVLVRTSLCEVAALITLEATEGLASPPVASRALSSACPSLQDAGEYGLQVATAAVTLVPASAVSSAASAVASLTSVASAASVAPASARVGKRPRFLHEADLTLLQGEAAGALGQE